LNFTTELAPPPVSDETKAKFNTLLLAQNEWVLSILDQMTSVTKSLSIALALIHGRLTVDQAYEAARVEENYQIKMNGRIDGLYGHAVDIEFVKLQLATAKTFANLLKYTNTSVK